MAEDTSINTEAVGAVPYFHENKKKTKQTKNKDVIRLRREGGWEIKSHDKGAKAVLQSFFSGWLMSRRQGPRGHDGVCVAFSSFS